MQRNSILELESVSVGYFQKKKEHIILKNITVSVMDAKFIALVGKNGVGKSTLLRSISRVQPILNGTVKIQNKNIKNLSALELSKQLSIVLSERIPPSNFTVYEIIALGRQVYTNWIGKLTKKDIQIINNAIDLCAIKHLKHKKIEELSDGQYQKVMIARAIAQDTTIILLDEPTAHLDIENKIEIFHLLHKLVKTKKKTILISSHEIQLCLKYVDDLWILSENNFIAKPKKIVLEQQLLNSVFSSKYVQFDAEFRLK